MGSSSCMGSKCQAFIVNVKGFSPHQLFFGRNIDRPLSVNDKLSTAFSEISLVLQRLNSLYSLRQSFLKIELSKKLTKHYKNKQEKQKDSVT